MKARSALESLKAARLAVDAAIAIAEAEVAAPSDPSATPLPRFLSRKAARLLLGLEVRAFNRAARELGAVRPGREMLVETARLVEWIREQRGIFARGAPTDESAPIPIEQCRFLRRKVG